MEKSRKCKCSWLSNSRDLRNKRSQFGEIIVFVKISTMPSSYPVVVPKKTS